jgi:peroxiredoxin
MKKTALLLMVAGLLALASPAFAILQRGQQAPPFSVVTTSGQPVTMANYKGHVLVIDFFATWCTPCSESIPHLVNLTRKYGKQGLQVLGMSVDEGGDRVLKAFIADRKITYPVAIANEDLQTEYSLRSIPTLYLINKKGAVVERFQGYSQETGQAMEAAIKRLLAE